MCSACIVVLQQPCRVVHHHVPQGGEPELAVAADCVQSQVDVFVPVCLVSVDVGHMDCITIVALME